jgi:uncharacterized delta-60 repeat protein
VDQGFYGNNNGIRVDYTFTASGTTQAISIARTGIGSFHIYGIALNASDRLIASDTLGASFAAAGNWNTAAAPASGNNYVTGAFTLKTATGSGNQTFAGDSLTIDSGGSLSIQGSGTITANNLSLNGGSITNGLGSGVATLQGSGMTVAANSTLDGGGSGKTLLIQSAMGGSAGLTIQSSGSTGGVVQFTAANTYTGATAISTGATLNLSGAGNANNSDITLAGTGNLTFTATDGRSFTKAITGSGGNVSFNVAGDTSDSGGGSTTSFGMSNTGAFTGTVVVNTGLVSASSNSAFGNTANVIQLNAASGQSAGLMGNGLTLASTRAIQLTQAGGNSVFRAFGGSNFQIDGQISGAGNLVKTDGGTLILTGANTYTGATTVSTGALNIQNANALGTTAAGTSVTSGAALQIQGNITTAAEAVTLNGTGVSTDGALRNISGTNTYAGLVTLGAATRINSDAGTLTLSNAGTITGSGLGLTVGGAGNTTISSIIGTGTGTLTKDGAGTLTLSGTNTFSGNVTVSAGTLEIAGTGSILRFANASTVTIASGATALLSTTTSNALGHGHGSAEQWVVAGTVNSTGGAEQSFPVGGVTLNGGTLTGVASGGSFGTYYANGSQGAITANGTGNTLSAADVGINSGATLTLATPLTGDTLTASAVFKNRTSAGNLTKTGSGTVTLTGANTYTGATTISAGTLQVGNGSTTGALSTSSAITNNGTLQFFRSNTVTQGTDFASVISGTGVVQQAGTGTLVLNGANTYNGATTVSAGTLQIGDGGTTGALSASSSITNNATLAFNRSNTITQGTDFNSVISGTGAVMQAGSGTLVLSGANTFSGVTTVSAGVVNVQNATGLGSTAGSTTVSNGATLQLQGGITVGAEALSLNGGAASGQTGALVNVSGTNTYGGAVTVTSSSSISAASGSVLNLTGGLVKNGTVATLNGGGTINVNTVAISGASANSDLVIDGTTVNVDVASTYNGPTFIRNSGTLNANVTDALPTANGRTAVTFDGTGTSVLTLGAAQSVASLTSAGAATVTLGANTLTVGTSTGSTSFAGSIGGSGGLTKDGASTLILSGSNGYTGSTLLSAGTLSVTGSIGSSSLTTINGGTLMGTGTVGAIQLNSAGAVNLGTGTLSTGNIAITDGQLVFNVGSTSSYGRLSTSGTVNLTNGGSGAQLVLNAINGYTAQVGDTFTLITNDLTDAISGNFAGLTEGQRISNVLGSSLSGQITYVGGTGNDVVLMVVSPPPTVTSVTPSSGSTAGGTSVTITGTNLTGATGVTIGGTAATSVVVTNDTTITCTTPAGSAGTASVVVTTAGGSNAANTLYTYVLPSLVSWYRAEGNTVDTVGANPGTAQGGLTYAAGKVGQAFNLNGSSAVNCGNNASLQLSNGTISAWIKTSNAGGSYRGIAVKQNAYGLFLADNVLMVYDWAGGGNRSTGVSLNDNQWHHVAFTFQAGVSNGSKIYIDGNLSSAFTWNVSGQGVALAIGAGDGNGIFQNFTGLIDEARVYSSALSATDIQNSFISDGGTLSAPTVTAISPTSGSTAGGTSVTLTGTNFTGATGVTIGGAAATGVSVVSATSITCTTPAGTAGTASVVVTTAGGSNAANTLFTYNSAPTDIALSSSTIAENNAANATVGTLNTTDADVGDTFTYTLVSGTGSTDNGSFTIAGSSLKLTPGANYETQSSYAVRVRTTDAGGLFYEEAFTISITDVNETPVITSNGGGATASISVAENTTTVTTVTATDPEVPSLQTLTYSKTGADAALFTISSSTGVITFTSAPNYELPLDAGADNVYNVTVTASDNGSPLISASQDLSIAVTDVVEVQRDVSNPWTHSYGGVNAPTTRRNGDAKAVVVQQSAGSAVAAFATGFTTNAAGNKDIYTVCYNPATGAVVWENIFNGAAGGHDEGNALAVDGNGDLIVTGYSTNASGNTDVITVKYAHSDGTQLWQKIYAGSGNGADVGTSVAVDASNNVAVAGCGTRTATGLDVFGARYASDGSTLFEVLVDGGSSSTDLAASVAVDSAGNLLAAGYATKSGTAKDLLVVKLSAAAGTSLWTWTANGSSNAGDQAYSVAVGAADAVFVTGSVRNSNDDIYLAKLSSAGAAQWSQQWNSPNNSSDASFAVTLDGQGNLILAGHSYKSAGVQDGYLAKYNSATGALMWDYRFDGPASGNDILRSVGVDKENNLIATGYSQNASGTYDMVILKLLGADGGLLWTQRYSGSGNLNDEGRAVAVTDDGQAFVAGYATSTGGTSDFLVTSYSAAVPGTQTAQTITFANPGAQNAGTPLALSASSSSGLTVRFNVVSGSATFDSSSNTLLNFTGDGSVTVRATQSGSAVYAAATPVDQTFTVSKSTQTISFVLPASLNSSAQWPLTGVASSGLAVTYNVQSGPGSITDGVLSFSGAGDVTVRASQAGDGRFNAASNVDAVVTSQNRTPVVIFDNIVENWRDTYAGSGAGAGNDIALQLSGNNAVAGFVAGYTTTSSTGKDLYLVKYLADGTLVWSVASGTSGDDEAISVVVDGNGDVVVAGYVTGTGRDLYVAKYNGTTGSKIWDYTYSGTGSGNDVGVSLALDGTTNVVVGGYAVGSGTSNDFFAAKLNLTSGALVWASVRNRTGATSDVPAKVAVGTDGSVVLAGATNSDAWTVKLAAADGTLVWQIVYNFLNKPDAVRGLALDAANNVIIAAYSQGSNYDIYTAKYASLDGTLIWGKRYNSSFNSSDHPWDLAVDEDSNVYVTGASYRAASVRDGMTLKYAGLDGTLMWEGRYNGTSSANDENFTISLDGIGNPVISGYTTNADGTTDVYLAKHNRVPGTIRWQNAFDGANNKNDSIQKVKVDPNGNVWMAGSATGADGKLVILVLRNMPTP